MPDSVTSLVLNVASDSVEKSTDRLVGLTKASGKAERSQKTLATTSTATGAAIGKNATATGAAATSTTALSGSQASAATTAVTLATAQTEASRATTGAGVAAAATTATTHNLSAAQAGAATTAKSAAVATKGLTASMLTLAAPLLAVLGPLLLLNKAFKSTIELQDYEAQLKTATGTVENAGVAFEALEGFASETPFVLEQSIEAFIKLTNLGLTPSERALRSYGNTASAMGKDLTQLIEAVADATTGEFERLKEFGIKARSEGDRVSLTFRGMTTTIGKNAAEIEAYLIGLGENEFAGAMSDRMATLGGEVSNLEDSWNKLFREISEAGVGDAIASGIDVAATSVRGFVAYLDSGQFQAEMESWGASADVFSEEFESVLNFLTNLLGISTDDWTGFVSFVWEEFTRGVKILPAVVKAASQRIGVELFTVVSYVREIGILAFDVFVKAFGAIVDIAITTGVAIGEALNPFDDVGFLEAFQNGLEEAKHTVAATGSEIVASYNETKKSINDLREARLAGIKEIQFERDQNIAAVDAAIAKSAVLRATYNAEAIARQNARSEGDALEGFKIVPKVSAEAATFQISKEAQKLIEQLRTQEEAIEQSYAERLKIIEEGTFAGSELQLDLLRRAEQQYKEQLARLQNTPENRRLEALKQSLQAERAEYDSHFDKLQFDRIEQFDKDQQILIAGLERRQLTEEEFQELSKENWLRYNEDVASIAEEQALAAQQSQLQNYGVVLSMAGDISNELSNLAEEGSAAQKGLFVAQKGIAIAQAIINTELAATRALAEGGGIFGIPMATAIRALGYASVGLIAGQTVSSVGNFENGGIVPGNSFTGDNVVANVNSGEAILNQTQQRRLLDMANGTAKPEMAEQVAPMIKIVNVFDDESLYDAMRSSDGERVIVNTMRRNKEVVG